MPFISHRSRRARLSQSVGLALLAAFVACSSDSFLVVKMVAPSGTTVANVAFVQVSARNSNGKMSPLLQFDTPRGKDGSLVVTLDDTVGKDFSLQFSSSERGPVDLVVSAFSPGCACVAEGALTQTPLNHGGTANTTVVMAPAAVCTNACQPGGTGGSAGGMSGSGGTGGTRTGGTGGGSTGGATSFPGCDPASPTACASGETCFVDCANSIGMCVRGGSTPAGGACNGNEDCVPGSQCFDFGCNVKTCLAFCASDAQCTTRMGAGSSCADPVMCATVTSYRTCTSACDPTGATSGCATGLSCFLFSNPRGGEDIADCSCPGNRTQGDGQACATSNDCKAGLVCHTTGNTKACRPLCKRDSASCGAGRSCQMVTNSSVYGVCLTQ